jgi:Arc/MetJ family transcription regulator
MRDDLAMRTTIEIDDDLLAAVRSLGAQRGQTLGRVICALLRKALRPSRRRDVRNGVRVFESVRGAPVPTLELVNAARDEEA